MEKARRGRKSTLAVLETTTDIKWKQHHFDYSDEFAKSLAEFANAHLEDTSKTFKAAWSLWRTENIDMITNEVRRMESAGYSGSVEDKMYFSARYYYRKKAIRNAQAKTDEEKPLRKKYESTDSEILTQMNEHILSQIYCIIGKNEIQCEIRELTPSKSFLHYCSQHGVSTEDARLKKNYKNLFWRISKKIAQNGK